MTGSGPESLLSPHEHQIEERPSALQHHEMLNEIVANTCIPGPFDLRKHHITYTDLRNRFPRLCVAKDFAGLKLRWLETHEKALELPLHSKCVLHKAIDETQGDDDKAPAQHMEHRFQSRVMLMTGFPREEIARLERGGGREGVLEMINFLIARVPSPSPSSSVGECSSIVAIGGVYDPNQDGAQPTEQSLINTAVRCCKLQTRIDLSRCTEWHRFLDIEYERGDEVINGDLCPAHRVTTVIWIPNIWDHIPDFDSALALYKEIHPLRSLRDDKTNNHSTETTTQQQHAETAATASSSGGNQDKAKEAIASAARLAAIDPKVIEDLKASLRAELESAFKELLATVDGKKQVQDKLDTAVQKRMVQQHEEAARRLADTQRHTAREKLKEPQGPAYVFAARDRSKFRCSTVTLSTLLDYDTDDILEQSFEVSVFAEFFVELLQLRFSKMVCSVLTANVQYAKIEKDRKDSEAAAAKARAEQDKAPTEIQNKPQEPETIVIDSDDEALVPVSEQNRGTKRWASETMQGEEEGHSLKKPKVEVEEQTQQLEPQPEPEPEQPQPQLEQPQPQPEPEPQPEQPQPQPELEPQPEQTQLQPQSQLEPEPQEQVDDEAASEGDSVKYGLLKVKDLRALCKARGLNHSGTKEAMIERLKEFDAEHKADENQEGDEDEEGEGEGSVGQNDGAHQSGKTQQQPAEDPKLVKLKEDLTVAFAFFDPTGLGSIPKGSLANILHTQIENTTPAKVMGLVKWAVGERDKVFYKQLITNTAPLLLASHHNIS
eukprot:c16500_g1_i2.p1 GENE.c16500_g1_i2~~c16500_g1_i2.p1  ORF type:complete len:776 (+),score=228.55 c16500_g1_i2:276-2603(+)